MRGLYKSDYPCGFLGVQILSSGMLIILHIQFTVMHIRWDVLIAIIVSAVVISGGCTSTTSPSTVQPLPVASQPVQSGQQQVHMSTDDLNITVDSLNPGAALPEMYTCKGTGASPPVSWSGVPSGTKSLVLIVDDPDAPAGTFTHWLVYNIPPESGELAEGQTNAKVLSNGAQQGESSTGLRGYFAPCPPVGPSHRYIFRLYALDTSLAFPTADRSAIDRAITGHVLAKTEFISLFKR